MIRSLVLVIGVVLVIVPATFVDDLMCPRYVELAGEMSMHLRVAAIRLPGKPYMTYYTSVCHTIQAPKKNIPGGIPHWLCFELFRAAAVEGRLQDMNSLTRVFALAPRGRFDDGSTNRGTSRRFSPKANGCCGTAPLSLRFSFPPRSVRGRCCQVHRPFVCDKASCNTDGTR